jgi:hypothetical protein
MSRAVESERGVALIGVMAMSTLLLALGVSLATTAAIEVGIADHHRDAVSTLHAADSGLEFAIGELSAAGDWDAVLAGVVRSTFHDGAGVVALPDGSTLDVAAETAVLRCGRPRACGGGDMDLQTAERPWGRNNPRWTVYASGRLAQILGDAAPATRAHVVVWVADDASENDGDPLRDGGPPLVENEANPGNPGRGAIRLQARAYGSAGTRRTVEAVIERDPRMGSGTVRLRAWREIV